MCTVIDRLYCAAVVQFKFSSSDVANSEGGDLPSQLSILKIGQNDVNITFQVLIIPGTAQEGTGSYIAD